jgi:MFS family permease
MQTKKWLSKDLVGFSLTSLFNDFSHEMTTSLLPAFVTQIAGPAYGPIALGLITGLADALSTGMKLLSGLFANRLRFFKPILVLGYAITPLFVGLIGTAHYVWQIGMYQTLAWMGRGLREPIRDVWLSKISSPNYYGRIFGLERAADTIGAIAGPVTAFFIIQVMTLESSFFVSFIPGAISVLCIIFLTTNFENKIKKIDYSWKKQLKNLPANFTYFVTIMFIFGIANFNKTFFIYRAQEMLLGQGNSFILATSWSILLYVLLNCVRAVAEACMGYISDYIDRKKLLTFFGFGLFGLVNIALIFTQSQLLLWIIIFVCAGWSLGTVTSLEKSYAAQLLPEQSRGVGFGVLQGINGIGDLLSSIIVGALWNFISPVIAFSYAAVLSFVACILFFTINDSK